MIESDWKKFCERVRDKQTIAQDEVVIKEAIEALHPGQSYTMTNIDPYRIVFGDSREYDPVAILTKVKEMNYTCLLYTSPSPRDRQKSRMPSSA